MDTACGMADRKSYVVLVDEFEQFKRQLAGALRQLTHRIFSTKTELHDPFADFLVELGVEQRQAKGAV